VRAAHRIHATSKEAKRKELKVAVGLHRRHKRSFQEVIKRIHAGEIGDLVYTRSFANTPLRTRVERKPELGELEYQCRNWYYFSWLSGDFIVDNLVHGIDISNWAHGGYPVRCHGMGGLGERIHGYGNLFDPLAIEWEYAGGARLFGECDRRAGCWAAVTNHAIGTRGRMDFLDRPPRSSKAGQGAKGATDAPEPNPYQVEHDDFFAAIRNNQPYNEAEYGAKSTFTAIMGRMAAYSGKVIEWDAAFASNLSLAPDIHAMDDPPPVHPEAGGFYPVPVPGKTEVL
jgi:predicted dehydrogenase